MENKLLTLIDMKFFRKARYALFYRTRNEEILEELKVEPDEEKLNRYKSNSLRHATRINNRMPNIMLNYRPDKHRRLGRTLKRLLDEAAAVYQA
jgi:hypothetical protein